MLTDTATQLVLRRTYNASPQRLFRAWTTPEILTKFLGPGEVEVLDVTADARVGGKYSITFRDSDGDLMVAGGTYRELLPPERIVCTWAWEEDDPKLAQETLLTLEFRPRGAQTELVLTHEHFRDETQRDNHQNGWTQILDKLQRLQRPFSITGLDLSGYMVKDAARAIAFYRDVLGLEPTRLYPEDRGAEYEFPDGMAFGLWGGGEKVMPFQPSNGTLFAVDDLDAAVAAVRERGIPVVTEIELPHCRMAAINDTEGNTIFLHRRKTAVDRES
jgi:uncharacterized protein YndB with AHSA1/START domain/predicted enzyme related to lactoylglutathione lyase